MTRDVAAMQKMGTSVYDRVKSKARAAKQDVPFAFQKFALERFMVRLQGTAHAGGYALKGGMLMLCLPGGMNRPTEDLDLSSSRDMGLDELLGILGQVCTAEPDIEDGLTYCIDIPKSRVMDKVESPHPTVRVMIDVVLHNRYGGVPVRMMLDVSQGEGIYPGLARVRLPQTCKGFEPPELPCYPWETVIAEKLHSVSRRGAGNTRMKDFYDLVAIFSNTSIAPEHLADAVVVTFGSTNDAIQTMPYGLTEEFAQAKEDQWADFIRRRKITSAPASMVEAVALIRQHALPILALAAQRAEAAPAESPPF